MSPAARRRATDHRALVLEAVATHPGEGPTFKDIVAQATTEGFSKKKISSMVWQLSKEGLMALKPDGQTYFITKAGLDWLTYGVFDRALPAEHTRPKSRRRKLDQ